MSQPNHYTKALAMLGELPATPDRAIERYDAAIVGYALLAVVDQLQDLTDLMATVAGYLQQSPPPTPPGAVQR